MSTVDARALSVPGFRFAGVAAGIKANGKPDLGLIVADEPVPTAAVYTRNLVQAAPVLLARQRTKKGKARAILVNAGCANACTGKPGLEAAKTSTASIAEALGIDASQVIPASTGVIGALLPAHKIVAAREPLIAALSAD